LGPEGALRHPRRRPWDVVEGIDPEKEHQASEEPSSVSDVVRHRAVETMVEVMGRCSSPSRLADQGKHDVNV
jgi:methyl coenzyme M reductase subunit C-like uncharacterized protein (methanogenesis marker protein 7)